MRQQNGADSLPSPNLSRDNGKSQVPVIILATTVPPPALACPAGPCPSPAPACIIWSGPGGPRRLETRRDLSAGAGSSRARSRSPGPHAPPLSLPPDPVPPGFCPVAFCRHFEFMSGDPSHSQRDNHWCFELGVNDPMSHWDILLPSRPGVWAAGHCQAWVCRFTGIRTASWRVGQVAWPGTGSLPTGRSLPR